MPAKARTSNAPTTRPDCEVDGSPGSTVDVPFVNERWAQWLPQWQGTRLTVGRNIRRGKVSARKSKLPDAIIRELYCDSR
jgi:hypothetical protein